VFYFIEDLGLKPRHESDSVGRLYINFVNVTNQFAVV